jgi:hypothetical protein
LLTNSSQILFEGKLLKNPIFSKPPYYVKKTGQGIFTAYKIPKDYIVTSQTGIGLTLEF